jgi:hypothetical protein
MPNSFTLTAPGFGHTVGHLGCMPSIISAFVDSGSTSGLDTACVADMSPPPFVLPSIVGARQGTEHDAGAPGRAV